MKKFRFECWNVAFRKHNTNIESNSDPFVTIKNPLLYWAADPFIILHNNKYYVFAELYNRLTYKGVIKYCVLNENGEQISRWKKALCDKKHLSFPFVFKQNNIFYMMPESSKSCNLALYKALSFPKKWKKESVLIENDRVADSIFLDNETLYTFDNYSRPRKAIVYKSVNNEWVRTIEKEDPDIIFRPAGKVFLRNGKAIVPLQDSSKGQYGENMYFASILCEKNKLTITKEFSFDKSNLHIRNFKKEVLGVHTYNFDGEFEVIDIKTSTFNVLSFLGYCIKKIKSLFEL